MSINRPRISLFGLFSLIRSRSQLNLTVRFCLAVLFLFWLTIIWSQFYMSTLLRRLWLILHSRGEHHRKNGGGLLSFFDARRSEDEDQLDQTTKMAKSEIISWPMLEDSIHIMNNIVWFISYGPYHRVRIILSIWDSAVLPFEPKNFSMKFSLYLVKFMHHSFIIELREYLYEYNVIMQIQIMAKTKCKSI